MKKMLIIALVCLAGTSWGWETIRLDVPAGSNEAAWRDALAEYLGGKTEVVIRYGRVDVLTKTLAIELDWAHKYHECLGQALHYAQETGRPGVAALIQDGSSAMDSAKLAWIDEFMRGNGVQVVVLLRKTGARN